MWRRIFRKGSGPGKTNCSPDSLEGLLFEAVKKDDPVKMSCLLLSGADVNAREPMGVGCYNATPLHVAAKRGNLEILRELLDHGAEVNAEDSLGLTPLLAALELSKPEAAQLLVDRGARINVQAHRVGTPLTLCIRNNYTSLVEQLIVKGANVNEYSYLGIAAATGNLHLVKLLIAAGADVQGDVLCGAAMAAPRDEEDHQKRLQVAKYLLGQGASVHTRSDAGRTPLH